MYVYPFYNSQLNVDNGYFEWTEKCFMDTIKQLKKTNLHVLVRYFYFVRFPETQVQRHRPKMP